MSTAPSSNISMEKKQERSEKKLELLEITRDKSLTPAQRAAKMQEVAKKYSMMGEKKGEANVGASGVAAAKTLQSQPEAEAESQNEVPGETKENLSNEEEKTTVDPIIAIVDSVMESAAPQQCPRVNERRSGWESCDVTGLQ